MPPWEKYKKPEGSTPGPWAKYGGQPAVVTPEQPGALKRADIAAGNVVQAGLDTIAAPFELAGEALRLPMEGKPLSDFRAPTIVQRFRDNSTTAANPPADPFAQINKGVRAAAGAVEGVFRGGVDGAKKGAKAAYSADRGAMGTAEDMALALVTGKVSPKTANAPADAFLEGARIALRQGKKIAAPFKGMAKSAGKALISTTLGPSVKDINMRISRNPEIVKAKPFEVLAQELPDEVMKVSQKVGELSGAALDTLSPSRYIMEGAAAKESLIGAVRSEKANLGRTVSDSNAHAKKVLDRYAFRLRRLGNTVSEQELGKIVRDIDNDIDWSSKDMTPLNNALEGVRTRIDGLLKGQNTAYAEAMVPVAEGTRLIKKLQSIFQVENDIGKGFKAKNSTAAALKGAIDEKRLDSRQALEGLKGLTGRDLLREVENAGVAEAFTGGRANGSRRVNLGAALGAAVGAPIGGWGGASIGSLTGAMTGAYIDTQGGRMAGSLIDSLVRASNSPRRGLPGIPSLSDPMRRVLSAASAFNAPEGGGGSKIQEILSPRLPDGEAEASIQDLPVDAQAFRMGLDAMYQGNIEATVKAWQRALELNPGNEEARRGLERLAQKDGKNREAYIPKARVGR